MRYSHWTYPVLTYISFLELAGHIVVEMFAKSVLFLDLSRGRMQSACFPYDLTPDELRDAVADLRKAGQGIERWIVPGLEFSSLSKSFRKNNPATYSIIPELLQSCRDLPVAERWKQIREIAFRNAANPGRAAGKPRGKPPKIRVAVRQVRR